MINNYFCRYFKAYSNYGIKFWALTPQNEPSNHLYIEPNINAMVWTAADERDWVINYLSPTLKRSNFGNIKIFAADDTIVVFPEWIKLTFQNNSANDIISGIAIHWYLDNTTSYVDVLDEMKRQYPNKSLIYTEASIGFFEGLTINLSDTSISRFTANGVRIDITSIEIIILSSYITVFVSIVCTMTFYF